MYEPQGPIYQLWRFLVRWQVLLVVRLLPADFGLAAPRPAGGATALEAVESKWWEAHLYKIIRRAFTAGLGRLARVILEFIAVLLLFALLWLNVVTRQPWPYYAIAGVGLLLFDLLVVTSCYTAYVSLRSLPPERFADTMLAGRSTSDILRVLAWEIRATTDFFAKATHPLDQRLPTSEDLDRGMPLDDFFAQVGANTLALTRELQRLSGKEPGLQAQFRRLFALKMRAAELLDVHPRRFCDHIVQYSPNLHQDFLGKYVANWTYVLDAATKERSKLVEFRVRSLIRENHRMLARVRSRAVIQTELFHYDDLHAFVHLIAAQQSMSDATLAYARAISKVAETAADRSIDARLRFLYRKQSAYPGFDLHSTCMQLCKEWSDRGDSADSCELAGGQRQLLERIANGKEITDAAGTNYEATRDIAVRRLKALAITTETYFQRSRDDIANQFGRIAHAWFDYGRDAGAKRAVVVFDYSKTVRQALKTGLSTVGHPLSDGGFEPPLVCVLFGEGQREAAAVRTVYELTDDEEYRRLVAVGNEAQIASVLGRKWRVMVVIGVEAFDDTGSLVHWKGAMEHLHRLRQRLHASGSDGASRLCIVVVAGNYKRSKAPLTGVLPLLKYHLRHVEVSHDLWDFLVTDTEVIGREQSQRAGDPKAVLRLVARWTTPLSEATIPG